MATFPNTNISHGAHTSGPRGWTQTSQIRCIQHRSRLVPAAGSSAAPTTTLDARKMHEASLTLDRWPSDSDTTTRWIPGSSSVANVAVSAMVQESRELSAMQSPEELSRLLGKVNAEGPAVSPAFQENHEVTAMQLSEELSRLMEEVDAEFSALLSTGASIAAGGRDPPQPSRTSLFPTELSAAAAAPRLVPPVGASSSSASAASNPSASSSISGGSLLPFNIAPGVGAGPGGTLAPSTGGASLLALPPVAPRTVSAGGAGAGSRAQRRKANWQRANAPVVDQGYEQEAKFKTAGKTSMSYLLGGFTRDKMLNHEEEVTLATAASDFLHLQSLERLLRRTLRRTPSLEEMAAASKTDAGSFMARLKYGRMARTILAQKNYRLVVALAKSAIRYYGGMDGTGTTLSISIDDATAAGMEALMIAVQKYKPESGYRLSTYATWWIRQAVTKYVKQQQQVVSVPGMQRTHLDQVNRARRLLSGDLKRAPTLEELSEATGLPLKRLHEVELVRTTALVGKSRSLEAPVAEGREDEASESLAPDRDSDYVVEGAGSALSIDSEEFYAWETELTATVDDVLSSLDQQDAEALRGLYGLDDVDDSMIAPVGAVAAAVEGEAKEGEAEKPTSRSRSGVRRTNRGRPRNRSAALRKLRDRGAQDARLQEWVEAKASQPILAARSAGYAKKD